MQDTIRTNYENMVAKAKASCDATSADAIVVQIGSATCENAAGADAVRDEFQKHIDASGRDDIIIRRTGCTGRCSREPIVSVTLPGEAAVKYQQVNRDVVHQIFTNHIKDGSVYADALLASAEESASPVTSADNVGKVGDRFFNLYGDVDFFKEQRRIALRNAGIIDPESLDEYVAHDGFSALAKILQANDPEAVVAEVTASQVRGRGGGGFPTGRKWGFARGNEEKTRYMVCNADEGDPGAFMDRSMLESDPFNVVEGMLVGGFAIGAQRGFFYIRAEYPLAIRRIEHALKVCRENNLLGKNILGSGFDFDIEIRLGAGAFVCGEETALLHSIEGERGQPSIRPPYPAVKGLWGKPTIINNVETLANIPAIIHYGSDWFKNMGTENSGGTKVFALAGKVKHTGLVEVPMGTTLRDIVFKIGGGVLDDKKVKAIQTGGPAGGCIPEKFFDTPVDFDTLGKLGSIMGSGGMIVLDETDCMVDVAKFFIAFSQDESCGKCTPCREGTKRMLEILERITEGKGKLEDLDKLERLAKLVKDSSLCGLGRACPNPVLSTLKHFREEYIAHVVDKSCPSKRCTSLIKYEIDADKCVGCTLCARNCPVDCISGDRKQPHVIDEDKCVKCGRCYEACRFEAINKL